VSTEAVVGKAQGEHNANNTLDVIPAQAGIHPEVLASSPINDTIHLAAAA
jgi:hypothetical protein